MNGWLLRLDHARWFRDELARIEDRAATKPHYVTVMDRGQLHRQLEARLKRDVEDLAHDSTLAYVHVLTRADMEGRMHDIEFVVLGVTAEDTWTYRSTVLSQIACQERQAA